jgi:D-tyrosyl-tRNA(Tyr) deacylase
MIQVPLHRRWFLAYHDTNFQAATTVSDHGIAQPLMRFFEEIGSLSGDWKGERTLTCVFDSLTSDRQRGP